MIEIIEPATCAEELRRQFGADAAEAEVMASGMGFDAREAVAYLEARADGKAVRRPRMKAWRA